MKKLQFSFIFLISFLSACSPSVIALDDDQAKSIKMIVIADEIAIHTQADEGTETIYCYKKGDVVYTFEDRYGRDISFSDDGQYWLHIKTPKGDGWVQNRYLICEHIWEKVGRIKKDGLADAEILVKSLHDAEKQLRIWDASISPNKRNVIVNIYCYSCTKSIVPLYIVNEGLVALLDAYAWLSPLWSDDSRWLAGMSGLPADGDFDVLLSLYDTKTQTVTKVDHCQNLKKVEFFDGYLIWLGFDDHVDDVYIWDWIFKNYDGSRYVGNEDYAGNFPVLWAYNLSTTKRFKLLDSFKLTIGYDERGHRQALMKPSVDCPAELKESKLYKEYLGNKALIWYDKME